MRSQIVNSRVLVAVAVCLVSSIGCSSTTSRSDGTPLKLLTLKTQESLRRVAASVVGVGAIYDYSVEVFNYEIVGKAFMRDKTSPTGYRLVHGLRAITISDTSIDVHGSGLIVYHDERRAVILSSHHLLSASDTINTFYRDSIGKSTDVLYSRATKTKSTYYVNDQNERMKAAEVLRTDARSDLGLVLTETSLPIGSAFPYSVAYEKELDWGDVVFVFGFPRQVKQLTLGIVSPSPYPGNFVIDAVTRFGYSGGPILVVQPDGSLQLAGIMRAMAADEVRFVAPPPDALSGSYLEKEDMAQLRTDHIHLIEYGTVYGIDAERIGGFLSESKNVLAKKGIALTEKMLPR